MSHAIPLLFIAVILVSSLGIICDAAIIYGIFRFKKLKTVPNIFLVNWAIADLLSIVAVPMNTVVYIFMFSGGFQISLCLIGHLTLVLHLAEVIFGIVLSIDWFTAAYYPSISEKFRNRHRLIIASVWLATLICFLTSAGLCIGNVHYYLNALFFVIIYGINLLFVIVLQLYRIIRKRISGTISYPYSLNGRLAIITIITCSYIFAIVNTAFIGFGLYANGRSTYTVSMLCSLLAAFSVLSSSIATLGVLCWFDKDFRSCLFPFGGDGTHERFENEDSESEDTGSRPVTNNSTNHITTNSNHNEQPYEPNFT